ncbi:F-box domain-containing protein [Clohesyomyces aquaticus]|uniref:F-box domain-containing protein n=1 Tax=Clohesyomyces aquaticus TaxID=1231657 RepID=A0A1Y1Z2Z3_9PLEO|nr:F-box domain-containing protein [Clohesyomyces aquaticus]
MGTSEIPPVLTLPPELLHHILSFLSLSDLLSISLVNRILHSHTQTDTLYAPFILSHLPGIQKPPSLSWLSLYKTHHPYWFIPASKLWFANTIHTGKLLIARYNPSTNAIEAFSLVAERLQPTITHWSWNPEAIIHTFSPRTQLDLTAPVIRLDALAYARAVGQPGHRLQTEIPMATFRDTPHASSGLQSRLMLTKPWPKAITSEMTPVWPPLLLPSPSRTRSDTASGFRDSSHRPRTLSELSTSTFRLRKWMEFSSRPHAMNIHVGEEIVTFATLEKGVYTPSVRKPWQGIWAGDYAGHGVEFLVVTQPDEGMERELPERARWAMAKREQEREREESVGSSEESWSTAPDTPESSGSGNESAFETAALSDTEEDRELDHSWATITASTSARKHDHDMVALEDVDPNEDIYHGRIEAIKLTGDPNIPRGEYTFIAPDIGPNGLIRIATESPFKGARIVKSVGHIAERGFRDDDFISSQLILISHDRLAQYWEAFGHVSFYQRVDVDTFTKVKVA